jgi:hypothetical protein
MNGSYLVPLLRTARSITSPCGSKLGLRRTRDYRDRAFGFPISPAYALCFFITGHQ